MLSIDTNTAWALCSYVDAGGTIPAGWNPIFKPPFDRGGNYAVLFQQGSSNTYALVIQGTKNLLDDQEDLDVETQVAFPCVSGGAISAGTNKGMTNVMGLLADFKTLKDYLNSKIPAGSQLLLTGHSLGGNLASAFLPWFPANIAPFEGQGGNLQGITFAAPTAGNAALANFLNSANYQANFNTNDVVPHVWGTAEPLNANDIQNMYSGQQPPGPACPAKVANLVAKKLAAIQANNIEYTQTNGILFTAELSGATTWADEMKFQHNQAYANKFGG